LTIFVAPLYANRFTGAKLKEVHNNAVV